VGFTFNFDSHLGIYEKFTSIERLPDDYEGCRFDPRRFPERVQNWILNDAREYLPDGYELAGFDVALFASETA